MGGVAVPTMKQRDDPLTTVMKGLSIAQSVFGIKDSMDKSDAAKKAADDEARGVLTPAKRLELSKTHDQVPVGTPGAVQMLGRDDAGNEEPVNYIPKAAAAKSKSKLAQAETERDGKAGTLIKYSDGTEEFVVGPTKKPEDKSNEHATTLRKEYDSHPVMQRSGLLIAAHDKIEQAANRPNPTPATDMSMVYGYIKMLDPTSTVMEGEKATAENSRGVPETISNLYNQLRNGARLTPEQRQNFLTESDGILKSQLSLQQQQDARFGEYANGYGLRPNQVIDPTFARAAQRLEARMQQKPSAPVAGNEPQNPNEIGLPKPKGTANAAPQGGATPGSVIELKTHPGKRFVVGADGETLTEIK